MKKSIFLIPLSILLAACSGDINDLDRLDLKGPVKSIVEKQFYTTHKTDRWEPGEQVNPVYKLTLYDKDGNYVKLFHIGDNGDTLASGSCRREKGDIVEETFYVAYNRQTSKTFMERVSDQQVDFEMRSNGSLMYEGANYYDSNGRIISQVQVVADREVVVHFVYEKGLMVESYQEDQNGERKSTQLFEYTDFDEKGNWTTQLVYLEAEKITPRYAVTRELEYY